MSNKNDSSADDWEELLDESRSEPLQKEYYFNPEAGPSHFSPKTEKAPASILNSSPKKSSQKAPSKIKKTIPRPSFFKKIVVIFLIGSFLVVGFLVFKAYKNMVQPSTDSKNVSLIVQGQKEIVSGASSDYKIILENKSNVNLKDIEIGVRFPSNFIALNFAPLPTNQTLTQYFWSLAALSSGEKQEIIVSGRLFGEIGSKQIITASSRYQLENFSSDFKVAGLLKTEITASVVSLKIEAPREILNGAEIEYLIKISPSAAESKDLPLKNLCLFIEYPENFVLTQTESDFPETAGNNAPPNTALAWLINDLTKEETFKIKGTVQGEAGEYQELLAKIGYYLQDKFILQAGESFITVLIKPEPKLTFAVNGFKSDSLNVDWNEPIEYSLNLLNQGETEFSDIILKLNFSGDELLNWQSAVCNRSEVCDFILTASPDNLTKTLVWTREQLPELKDLKSDQSADLKLKFALNAASNSGQENYHTLVFAQADVKIPGSSDSLIVKSDATILKIKTQVNLQTEARYYTDAGLKIGSGPLPPLVGASTSFRIFWQITNTSNALKNIKVFTILPDNAAWINKYQTFLGDLKYDAVDRQVVWTLSELKAYPTDAARVNFEISITPALDQLGEYLILTQETTLTAVDAYTNEPINISLGYLTTELENDPVAQGKGRVE